MQHNRATTSIQQSQTTQKSKSRFGHKNTGIQKTCLYVLYTTDWIIYPVISGISDDCCETVCSFPSFIQVVMSSLSHTQVCTDLFAFWSPEQLNISATTVCVTPLKSRYSFKPLIFKWIKMNTYLSLYNFLKHKFVNSAESQIWFLEHRPKQRSEHRPEQKLPRFDVHCLQPTQTQGLPHRPHPNPRLLLVW